jgi:hypothetical protein
MVHSHIQNIESTRLTKDRIDIKIRGQANGPIRSSRLVSGGHRICNCRQNDRNSSPLGKNRACEEFYYGSAPEIPAIPRMVHLSIGIAGFLVDGGIHTGECGARNCHPRLLQ